MIQHHEDDLTKIRRTINDVSLINVRESNFLQRVFDILTRRDRLDIVELRWWYSNGLSRECHRSSLPGELEIVAPTGSDFMRVWEIHREEIDKNGIAVYTNFPKGKTGLSDDFYRRAHRCLAVLPIKNRQDEPLGEMVIFFRHQRKFPKRSIEMLKALASTISLAIHRISLIDELSHQVMRIKEAERARNYFFASVSHDIRTPLNSIIGFTELLHSGQTDDATRRQYVDAIASSGRVLLQLVNDIIDLAKLESHDFQSELSFTDFNKIVSEIALAFLPQAQLKGLKVETKIDENFPLVEIDRRRIRQVLFNLVGNAVKFTDEGNVEISAAFTPDSFEQNTGDFVFSVRDTGRGIAEEDLQRLAMPFVQLMRKDASRGTGLGLAISRQFIEKLGGIPTVLSQVGVGSVFKVEFKHIRFKAKSAKNFNTSDSHPHNETIASNARSNMRFLIVDDIELNLQVLKSMINKLGVNDIVLARSAREALAILTRDEKPFTSVLTDMWMPEMSGWDLIKHLRGDARFSKLPVYAVTADVDVAKTYEKYDFNGVLIKPVTMNKLSSFLTFILQQANLSQTK